MNMKGKKVKQNSMASKDKYNGNEEDVLIVRVRVNGMLLPMIAEVSLGGEKEQKEIEEVEELEGMGSETGGKEEGGDESNMDKDSPETMVVEKEEENEKGKVEGKGVTGGD